MPTRNVNLTPRLNDFIIQTIKDGTFENASEVVRASLRLLEREHREYQVKLEILREAIREGDESGIVEGDVFAQVSEELGLPPRRR